LYHVFVTVSGVLRGNRRHDIVATLAFICSRCDTTRKQI
jgi:hypothetical protein